MFRSRVVVIGRKVMAILVFFFASAYCACGPSLAFRSKKKMTGEVFFPGNQHHLYLMCVLALSDRSRPHESVLHLIHPTRSKEAMPVGGPEEVGFDPRQACPPKFRTGFQ